MSIVGNVIGSASSGGAKLNSTQREDNGVMFLSLDSSSIVVGNTIGGSGGAPKALILKNEDGTEIPIVLVGSETVFTANANDIREGKIAATSYGKVTGTKVIPTFHTSEGYKIITANGEMIIKLPSPLNLYDFTKLQVLVCDFNVSLSDSVSTSKVSIDGKVYEVLSSQAISEVGINASEQYITLGITNASDKPCILRYFTYKEIE